MDKFFKAIGRFFKRIWDWIKTTGWIQPVLIVVIVFAVIFSFSSSSPLMKWIKGLANSDTTGEFYDAHKSVSFSDLYSDIYSSIPKYECVEGKKPDGKSAGTALNSKTYDGYTYVLFIRSDSNESTFKTFYSNVLTREEQKHFYVIDFREDENKESEYNMLKKEWEDDSGAVYFNYLLTHLYEFYTSDAYEEFSDNFYDEYGYYAKYTDTWELTTTAPSEAVNDLKFPLICKYKGNELIDFRFCDNITGNYGDNTAATVLSNFHSGL